MHVAQKSIACPVLTEIVIRVRRVHVSLTRGARYARLPAPIWSIPLRIRRAYGSLVVTDQR